MRRVGISGLGVVSPFAFEVPAYWHALLYQCVAPVTLEGRPFYRISQRSGAPRTSATAMALLAMRHALRDAELDYRRPSATRGISIGTGAGDTRAAERHRDGSSSSAGSGCVFDTASQLARRANSLGPILTISTACSAGLYSIMYAAQAIATGAADVMIAGGAEAFSRVTQACFDRIAALDPERCRPFDAGRAGTVLGEGSAILVLEDLDHAAARGCSRIYGTIEGFGSSADAYHVTAPEPSGAEAERCIRIALTAAGVTPADISAVVPHATGTRLNDCIEAAVLQRIFGDRSPPVTAIKSKVGHSCGAAGAFAVLTAALMIRHGILPPIANLQCRDPECALPFYTEPQEMAMTHVLVNAFGFGGCNSSAVIGAYAP